MKLAPRNWPLGKIFLLFVVLIQCSKDHKNQVVTPVSDKTCIVTDISKLEQIQIFPVSNPINQNISLAQVDPRSDAIMSVIGTPGIHPDFGTGQIGIPFILVCKTQSKIPVLFRANSYDGNYGSESDPGPYPVPLTAPIEGGGAAGGDNHVLAVDVDNQILYEMYNASVGVNQWEASSGTIWNLKINSTRTVGWTSCDAAGLPIFPLLVRYDEVLKGAVNHAIRFTLTKAKAMLAFTAPASHFSSGSNTNLNAPTPMGLRIRLKAGFDISSFSPTNQVILTAMKNYGLILADIGSDLFISGAPDDHWNNDDLHNLLSVKATDFEVVKMGEILTAY